MYIYIYLFYTEKIVSQNLHVLTIKFNTRAYNAIYLAYTDISYYIHISHLLIFKHDLVNFWIYLLIHEKHMYCYIRVHYAT